LIKIERRLNEILDSSKPLTFDQIRFIATEVLPFFQQYSQEHLEKLEQKLRNDIETKISRYGKKVTGELLSLDEIKRVGKTSIANRIRKYIIVECGLEFARMRSQLEEKVIKGDMSEKEYVKSINDLYKYIYSFCPGSSEEFDFVEARSIPYQETPISRKTYEYYKRVIEPEIKRIVESEIEELKKETRRLGLVG